MKTNRMISSNTAHFLARSNPPQAMIIPNSPIDNKTRSLASNWQLALVALLVLALLFLIFPRQTLVQKLYEQESLDELTQSYIQNLYRADRKNADIGILLTRAQQDSLDIKTLAAWVLSW